MTSSKTDQHPKALVTVIDDLESAYQMVQRLHEAGFAEDRIELITEELPDPSDGVETPKEHETTKSALLEYAEKWGIAGAGAGAVAGLLASVVTPFPGIALGMIIMGGVTGGLMGGMAGIEHAVEDDSVDLPSLDEYRQVLQAGEYLVIVHGTHEEMMRAKEIVSRMYPVRSHLHPLHGHLFHEHPSREH